MNINKFCLQHCNALSPKKVDFSSKVIIIHSEKNSTGKTTLLRAILYALGFSVPNTELIRFEDYEFTVDLTHKNEQIIVTRKDNLLTIKGQEFDLPIEQRAAHAFLFGTNNVQPFS